VLVVEIDHVSVSILARHEEKDELACYSASSFYCISCLKLQ
jgi:hypothetical protein